MTTGVRPDDVQDDDEGGMTVAAWAVIAVVLAAFFGFLWLMHQAGAGRSLW